MARKDRRLALSPSIMGFLVRPVSRTTHRMLRSKREKFLLFFSLPPSDKKNCSAHHHYYSPRPTAVIRLRDTIRAGTSEMARPGLELAAQTASSRLNCRLFLSRRAKSADMKRGDYRDPNEHPCAAAPCAHQSAIDADPV
jgi:hypothetical protein